VEGLALLENPKNALKYLKKVVEITDRSEELVK